MLVGVAPRVSSCLQPAPGSCGSGCSGRCAGEGRRQAQSGLNLHYVTLPGAAWDAMLRHSARKTPIHLITDEQAYKDVRASVIGLSCIFQPFAQATNPDRGKLAR